ncbi:flagellar biosynthesis protein FlhF [Polaromonas sp. CG_9.11]|uniref:flagellar biosynthesis protein FlhF n=1 Tax=Polaromonas sp. CG_9.11 TaxID=2787730 RepID=UPI0018CB4914|nr:flagellar biosynthesis protein FlhF [Polaromonas sp. CG_9.11]MBG6077838.1 flagellar biosynthesis protein FlhF [Polaromonas sp. CG_9.11]
MTSGQPAEAPTLAIVAPSILKALRLMREQLGPDAFILSSTVTAEGVEIVASLEAPAARIPADAVPVEPEGQPAPLLPAPAVSTAPVAVADSGSGDASVLREIHSMRGMIEEQLAGLAWNKTQRRDPLRGQLLRTLLGAGFSARLARDLLADLPAGLNHAGGLDYLKSAMACQMPMLEDEDALMNEGGVYALMGPTGVGKTTTTAKLAARCVMRFGAEKLALITTDSYRIGAYEQLRIYGQILGVAVHAVKDASDLETVLASLQDKHMVLIDTVGMSQRDRAVSDQIAMLCGASRPVKRLLLLNAASHGDTLNEVVKAYRHDAQAHSGSGLAGCILTKVDEATHPGALIDIVIRHQLPVHYVSSGQKVPENLVLGDRRQLIDSVFEARSQSAWFVPGEADLDEQPARSDEKVAAAEAVSRRLRLQCQQLIRTLAHNAQELTSNAAALAAADIGFDAGRALSRQLSDESAEQQDEGAIGQRLLSQAAVDSQRHCSGYVLASHGETSLPAGGQALAKGRLAALLSDGTGLPFAALLAPGGSEAETGAAAASDLRQLGNKPVVHLFPGMASFARIQAWHACGLAWMACAPASLLVALAEDGLSASLHELLPGLEFSTPEPVSFRGRAGLLSVAEMLVNVFAQPTPEGSARPSDAQMQRCVVRRIVDAASGKLVAHSYLLASVTVQARPQQLIQWASWQADAKAYFLLLDQSLPTPEGHTGPCDALRLDRLRVLAHTCLTAFRLQQAQQAWAAPVRRVLAQLAGQTFEPTQPVPGPVLLEGLGKLYVLLDALESGESAPVSEVQHAADGGTRNGLWKNQ